MREHRRPKRRGIAGDRLARTPLDPGEQGDIGRRNAVPDLLDLVGRQVAQRRKRGLGKPRRDADAQRAGDQLEQRPASGLVELVEPARQQRRQVPLFSFLQRHNDIRKGGRRRIATVVVGRGPQEGNRLRQVADIIVGHFEQHGVGALGNQCANDRWLGLRKGEPAGHGGQRIATFGIFRAAEIVADQAQLVVARRLVGETVEQLRKTVHAVSSALASASSSP